MCGPSQIVNISQPGRSLVLAFQISIWVVGRAVGVEAAWKVETADWVDGRERGEFGVLYGRGDAGFRGVYTGIFAVEAAGTGVVARALVVEIVWRGKRPLYGRGVGLKRGSRFVVASSHIKIEWCFVVRATETTARACCCLKLSML